MGQCLFFQKQELKTFAHQHLSGHVEVKQTMEFIRGERVKTLQWGHVLVSDQFPRWLGAPEQHTAESSWQVPCFFFTETRIFVQEQKKSHEATRFERTNVSVAPRRVPGPSLWSWRSVAVSHVVLLQTNCSSNVKSSCWSWGFISGYTIDQTFTVTSRSVCATCTLQGVQMFSFFLQRQFPTNVPSVSCHGAPMECFFKYHHNDIRRSKPTCSVITMLTTRSTRCEQLRLITNYRFFIAFILGCIEIPCSAAVAHTDQSSVYVEQPWLILQRCVCSGWKMLLKISKIPKKKKKEEEKFVTWNQL